MITNDLESIFNKLKSSFKYTFENDNLSSDNGPLSLIKGFQQYIDELINEKNQNNHQIGALKKLLNEKEELNKRL